MKRLTAQDAYEIATTGDKYIFQLLSDIRRSAERGGLSISYYKEFPNVIVQKLQDLGYKVKVNKNCELGKINIETEFSWSEGGTI